MMSLEIAQAVFCTALALKVHSRPFLFHESCAEKSLCFAQSSLLIQICLSLCTHLASISPFVAIELGTIALLEA